MIRKYKVFKGNIFFSVEAEKLEIIDGVLNFITNNEYLAQFKEWDSWIREKETEREEDNSEGFKAQNDEDFMWREKFLNFCGVKDYLTRNVFLATPSELMMKDDPLNYLEGLRKKK